MKIVKQLVLALGIVSLAACGGGGGGGGETGASQPASNTGSTTSSSSSSSSTTSSATPSPSGSQGTTPTQPSPVPVVSSTIALSWDIPAARENGAYLPVYEIDGYELRYSKDNSVTETVVRISDAQTTDWVLENAQPGVYEFSIATIDSDGLYSQFSASTSKTVQ